MAASEDIAPDWALRPGGGWADFVAARRRFLDDRARESVARRREHLDPGGPSDGTPRPGGPDAPPAGPPGRP